MAKIISTKTGKEKEISNGEQIKKACEEIGVPFSCRNGTCGSCMVDVIKGEDNLSELTEQEKDLERDKKHRLACQCKIKKGEVEIEF